MTDRRTDERTFVNVESLSRLKTFFDIGLGRKDGVKWADGVGWMKDG